ncbi:MAG: cell division protein FtsI/penicillin-binding protein 2 [Saprospiraceae bacterium]|jgi:cell division protein FtsI/penicillin-binding protein 2
MKMVKILPLFLIIMMNQSLTGQHILQHLLEQNKHTLSPVIQHAEDYEVQIIYTQIDRDKNNIPHFNTYTFNQNDKYYYPASTVKMPTAFVALEKLNQLKINGLNKYSTTKHGVACQPQTPAEADSTAATGLPSIAHYIKEIFLVSDNDAYNRLYEFLGQEYLNRVLYNKGFQHTRILHRLGAEGASFTTEDNKKTNPVSFYNTEKLLYFQGEVSSETRWDFKVKEEQKGKGFMQSGKLINEPFDFSTKNYISLMNLHDMLQSVIFPEGVPQYRRFDLREDDYQFLYHWMSAKPRGAEYPYYDEPDAYVKFFMFGGKEEKIPDHIKIFNKVGYAYGYLTDVAYIIDTEANIEFMLTATIHVNYNQVYNDNVYEYDTIGLPFLKRLGDIIYEYELGRERKIKPDLGKFIGK